MSHSDNDPRQASLFMTEEPVMAFFTVNLIMPAAPVSDVKHFFSSTRFGMACFAENNQGLCALAFADDKLGAASHVLRRFPVMKTSNTPGHHTQKALRILEDPAQPFCIDVIVNGTDFQKRVWNALLGYRLGQHSTYGRLAEALDLRKGARAVGTALGSNPVAFFIPCHRVLNANGASGHFRWGAERKKAMLDWERSVVFSKA